MLAEPTTLYDNLHTRVVNGEFAPEQRLKSEMLAKRFNSSASAVREVLFRLSTVGLVDFQEQRGFRVPAVSPERRSDLTRFRIMLECEGACLSIRKGGLAWEARLSAAHHKLSHIEGFIKKQELEPATISLWTAAELEFHQTLISACESDILKRTHEIIYQQFRQQHITKDVSYVFLEANIDQHKAILEAALDHDETAVRAKITNHLAHNICD